MAEFSGGPDFQLRSEGHSEAHWPACDVEVDRDTVAGVWSEPFTPASHGNLNHNYCLLQKHPGFLILICIGIMVLRGFSTNLFDPKTLHL